MRQPSAEGLFDAAGMISGGGVTISDNTNAKLLGERTVEILGLTEETIDEIQTIDYRTLLTAATQAQEELKEEGIETRWGPTADGVVVMDEFVTTDIPVIVSGVFSESAVSSYKYGDFRHHEWDEAETTEKLEERFADKIGRAHV